MHKINQFKCKDGFLLETQNFHPHIHLTHIYKISVCVCVLPTVEGLKGPEEGQSSQNRAEVPKNCAKGPV